MASPPRAFAALSVVLALGCAGARTLGGSVRHCFEMVDGDERTHIIIEEGDPARVTIQDPDGGNRQVTLGRWEPGAFVYGDGSRWRLDAQGVRGQGGLIEGLVGRPISCP